MFELHEVREIDISVCPDDLLGPLGYMKGGTAQPAIMKQILSETKSCGQIMRGKTIHTCAEIRRPAGGDTVRINDTTIKDETLAGLLSDARFLAVAICTVGAEIDKLIDEHFDRGDFLRGMIADVVGSRAVEDVAGKCSALICAEAKKLNLSTSCRLSPGYGTWDVSGQRAVFALLDPSPIGVSLNEHCMMQPRKSVSFVIPFVDGESHHKEWRPCLNCDFQDCSYRRT
ncbi:MAG: hypothetical protein JSV16_05095 [Candidatus Hydrogenedentota bacterium]|nr:MAG: hypothetical protein JSV16_05095 [Candidatus Hydrogenedentota bacterium]